MEAIQCDNPECGKDLTNKPYRTRRNFKFCGEECEAVFGEKLWSSAAYQREISEASRKALAHEAQRDRES